MQDTTPHDAAAEEAWEEAGAHGKVNPQCIGVFTYLKRVEKGSHFPCAVLVYPLKIKSLAKRFPEETQRKRKWFSLKKAAARVQEPELKQIIKSFDPRALRR